MWVVAFASSGAKAAGIGELSLFSRLGEPIDASLDVRLGKGEVIDDSCLSLSAVDRNDATGAAALVESGLTLKFDPVGSKIEIRSKRPLRDPIATFRIEVNCRGQASVSRVLTLLPDLGASPMRKPTAVDRLQRPQETVAATAKAPVLHSPKQKLPQASSESPPGNAPAGGQAQFELKLSTDPVDMARVGTLSANDLELILAQRKLMAEDDQTAHFLAMQHQVTAMGEEIQSLRLKLANLEAGGAAGTSPLQESGERGPWVTAQMWRDVLILFGALGFVVLAILGMRYARKLKARPLKPEIAPADKEQAILPPPKPVGDSTITIVHPARVKQIQANRALQDEFEKQSVKQTKQDALNKIEQTILEEAELYSVYGHADKAIKILQEFVLKLPQSENAWMLLLSIYSANAQATEFEVTARKFLTHHKHSPLWKTIQALGRTLDQDNELYLDEDNTGKDTLRSPSRVIKQRPIGDILIELGYLSVEDMRNCLGEFDPRQHGRFGNYLLMRKMINYAQLDEALLRQQCRSSNDVVSDGYSGSEHKREVRDAENPLNDAPSAESAQPAAPSTTGHVQDKASIIHFTIDDHKTIPATNEPAIPESLDQAQKLSFLIDFDPKPTAQKAPE